MSDRLDVILEPGTVPVKVNRDNSYGFTEGPANDGKGHLYFVDCTNSLIMKYHMAAGTFETWARDTKRANGSIFYKDGPLVSCRALGRDIVVWKENGTVDRVLASEYDGKPLNEPNDLIISRKGWVYFTDPIFWKADDKVLAMGVYSISPDGDMALICNDIQFPNGIVLTPDEKTLIIDGTFQSEVIAYNLNEDGSVGDRRLHCFVEEPDRTKFADRGPDWYGCDGMTIDAESNLYVTTGAGVQVFEKGGELLGIIDIPEKPCNLCFGSADLKTLYVTAQTSLYSLPCKIPGVIFQQ